MDPFQTYRERLPAPEIASHVASVWVLDVAADGDAYKHRTVPNGSVEISHAIGTDGVLVSGPQRGASVARVPAGTTLVGVRFRPGFAAALGPPATELVDLHVEADALWGRGGATLGARLADAGSPGNAARLLEEEVSRRIAGATAPDPLVKSAMGRLQPWVPSRVGERTADLFISPRQLRRRFVAALGYGPKTFQRIRRFQGFLALAQAHRDGSVGLARLARWAGYADQAHLTRECGALTGLTPRAFLAETWRSCGPNHDHEASFAGLRRALASANPGSPVVPLGEAPRPPGYDDD